MRIAIDVREWKQGTSTGIGRFVSGFVNWVSENSRHDLLLVGDLEAEQRADGARVRFVRLTAPSTWLWDQHRLPRLLAETGADVFLSPYYKMPLRSPCPSVITVHDLIDLHYPRRRSTVRLRLLRWWIRRMLEHADRIVTDSEFSRADIANTFGLEMDRIAVVPVGIQTNLREPPSAGAIRRATERYSLPASYVLYVGRHAPHKNVATLVEAWRRLPEGLREAHPLVLAGQGGRSLVGSESADPRPVAPGFIDDASLPGVYGGAAVFCFPSRYEGFGLPPLEAMGCGVPVIASTAASLPEVLGDAAVLVDPDDTVAWGRAIETILTDGETRDGFRNRGARQARRYDLRQTAGGLLEVIESAAMESRRGDSV